MHDLRGQFEGQDGIFRFHQLQRSDAVSAASGRVQRISAAGPDEPDGNARAPWLRVTNFASICLHAVANLIFSLALGR
jgi:hypothetical protein